MTRDSNSGESTRSTDSETTGSDDRGTPAEACDACGRHADLVDATVLDTSGGAYVGLCRACATRLKENARLLASGVCVCCIRQREPSKSEGVWFQSEEKPRHLCDECRIGLVFNEGDIGGVPDISGEKGRDME